MAITDAITMLTRRRPSRLRARRRERSGCALTALREKRQFIGCRRRVTPAAGRIFRVHHNEKDRGSAEPPPRPMHYAPKPGGTGKPTVVGSRDCPDGFETYAVIQSCALCALPHDMKCCVKLCFRSHRFYGPRLR